MLKPITLACTTLIFFSLPACALNSRTWVSGSGIDQDSCGPLANPCRTLQFAHDQTAAGGEIDVKDSAGYGAIAITKAINIISDGALGGVLAPANAPAISIAVGASDTVVLRGLTIEGGGIGSYGITLTSGGVINISGCTVQNFKLNGIDLRPPAAQLVSIAIENVDASFNGADGILFSQASSTTYPRLLISRSRMKSNGNHGIEINGSAVLRATVQSSVTFGNFASGVALDGSFYSMILDELTSSSNAMGVKVVGGVFIGRSTITGNAEGVFPTHPGQDPILYSFRNNQIGGNGQDSLVSIVSAPLQ